MKYNIATINGKTEAFYLKDFETSRKSKRKEKK